MRLTNFAWTHLCGLSCRWWIMKCNAASCRLLCQRKMAASYSHHWIKILSRLLITYYYINLYFTLKYIFVQRIFNARLQRADALQFAVRLYINADECGIRIDRRVFHWSSILNRCRWTCCCEKMNDAKCLAQIWWSNSVKQMAMKSLEAFNLAEITEYVSHISKCRSKMNTTKESASKRVL